MLESLQRRNVFTSSANAVLVKRRLLRTISRTPATVVRFVLEVKVLTGRPVVFRCPAQNVLGASAEFRCKITIGFLAGLFGRKTDRTQTRYLSNGNKRRRTITLRLRNNVGKLRKKNSLHIRNALSRTHTVAHCRRQRPTFKCFIHLAQLSPTISTNNCVAGPVEKSLEMCSALQKGVCATIAHGNGCACVRACMWEGRGGGR